MFAIQELLQEITMGFKWNIKSNGKLFNQTFHC